MTEAEWLACENPREMIQRICVWKAHTLYELGRSLGLLRQNKTERRYRLFACACLRLVWHRINNPDGRSAVELAEQYVEGEASFNELSAVRARIEASAGTGIMGHLINSLPTELLIIRPETVGMSVTKRDALVAAYSSTSEAYELLISENLDDLRRPNATLSNLFREIFGNPFRPVVFSPVWRTDTALSLSPQMYESREFSAMPILADALQDAGCDNEDILRHCRDANQSHVRGCWVVDLVLGK